MIIYLIGNSNSNMAINLVLLCLELQGLSKLIFKTNLFTTSVCHLQGETLPRVVTISLGIR